MSRIKVLNFPIANAKGGITQYALKNWEYIDKSKFKFDFATMGEKLDFEDELIESGADVFYITKYAEENKEVFVEEISRILENKYDIVHIHTSYWKSFLVEEIAKKYNVPKIIVHAHTTFIDIEDREKRNDALSLHEMKKKEFSQDIATDFWACSQAAGRWLYKDEICDSNLKIMYNAIELEKFRYNKKLRTELREKLDVKDSFVIGHIGRFTYLKNHDFLVDLFLEVSKLIPEAKLLLVGVGKLKNDIINKVKKNNIFDKVIFLEKIDNVSEILQIMDIFVLPSRFEGLGIVLIEAQAAGLKCFASDKIPDEAKVLDSLELIPLELEIWVSKILDSYQGYERLDTVDILRKKGYDIEDQIKKLESAYEVNIK